MTSDAERRRGSVDQCGVLLPLLRRPWAERTADRGHEGLAVVRPSVAHPKDEVPKRLRR